MKWIIAFILVMSGSVVVAGSLDEFEPAYAYLQKEITFDSLGQEISQFQQLAGLHSLHGQISKKKMELELLRKSYERGQKLLGSGKLSRDEFEQREYLYKVCESDLGDLEAQAKMNFASIEIAKMGITQQASLDQDLRKQIAAKMKEQLEFQSQSLGFQQKSAQLTLNRVKNQLANAKSLFDKGNLSIVDFEKRVQDHDGAVIQSQSIDKQVKVIADAIEGLKKSLNRLFGA